MQTLSKVQINLSLLDAIKKIHSYAKILKDVCTHKKKLVDFEKVVLTKQCSIINSNFTAHIATQKERSMEFYNFLQY